jgi:hypothetical protein
MISHCGVAQESTYGSPDANGLPSAAALTFKNLELDRGGIAYAGDTMMADRAADARCAPFELPPEPSTMWSAGSRVQHRSGDISLTVYPRGMGAGPTYSRPSAMPWMQLIGSALKGYEPGAASDTVTGTSAVALSVTTPASWQVGQIISVEIAGRVEFAEVTGVTAANIDISPALSITVPAATTIRFCDQFYFADDLGSDESVCLEMMTMDAQVLAFGCRMTSLAVKSEGAKISLDITLFSPHIEDVRPTGSVTCTDYGDGALPHFAGSYAIYSAAHSGTAPMTLARNVALCDKDSTTVSVTSEQAPTGYSGTLLAAADSETVTLTAEASLKLRTPDTALDRDLLDQVHRNLLLGFGPGGEGNGLCVMLGGAFLKTDGSKREDSESQWNQVLTWGAGRWAGDDASVAPANTAFQIASPR